MYLDNLALINAKYDEHFEKGTSGDSIQTNQTANKAYHQFVEYINRMAPRFPP